MIRCPVCNAETEVFIQRASIQTIDFVWKKRGSGIKRKKLNPTEKIKIEFDRRLFITCTKCNYETDNLSAMGDYEELEPYRSEIDLIEKQLDSIKF